MGIEKLKIKKNPQCCFSIYKAKKKKKKKSKFLVLAPGQKKCHTLKFMNFSDFFSQNSESIINFRKSHEISSQNVY